LALGCDSENAGDALDVLRAAALFAGLAKDMTMDPTAFTATDALHLATLGGAQAIGCADEIGSLRVGKRADIVLVGTDRPAWTPRPDDPRQLLVWASGGHDVRHVVAGGRVVVRDGECTTVDRAELRAAIRARLATGWDR
jgi:5-methylthioadenosine/S-adenosylhomocysteine deaminase